MSVINFLSGLSGFEDERRGKELLHSQGGSTPFKYKNEITRHSTHSHVLPVPNNSKRRKEEKNAMIWGSEQIKQSLMHPVRFLGRILKLGISRGIERCQEAYLLVHCRPQRGHPGHRKLNPTIQLSNKALVSQDLL